MTDRFARSKDLAARAARLIPGGAHTYSKGADQFPELAPGFLVRGEGCTVWDADGNRFLDWGMGLRSVVLGYGYPRVLDAVRAQLEAGPNFTRPAPIEVELAELIADIVPAAEMVKFSKNGSDVTSAAVRLARAFTGRDRIALCKDNPFFSFGDWFIGTTEVDAGVPAAVAELSATFRYNDLEGLAALFAAYPGEIACVVLEPVSTEPPHDGYLAAVRDLAHENGALLIFDEMISGFRWDLRGAQHHFGVTPDLCTFGKAIANGFSVSVLAGRRDVLSLGGIDHDRERVFLLSATHGAETHALAAAHATISEMRDRDVVPHLWRTGAALQEGINAAAASAGLDGLVSCEGYPCSPFIVCRDADKDVSLPFRTLFLQETIARGVLMPYLSISYAHGPAEVEQTLDAVRGAFEVYGAALDDGVEKHLVGPPVKPVFRRYP